MKHISILVPEGHTSLTNIEGAHQILSEVNTFFKGMGKAPLFTIELVGISGKATQRNGLFTIKPDRLIQDIKKTNLIIIPALHGDPVQSMERNKAFIPWIVAQHKQGAEIASFCIGAFFLASTGLLTGKQCATHWKLAHEFRTMFPEVNLVDDKIMTAEDGIYTSGGAYSYLNLLIYLVEQYAGRDIAILIAKTFMIDMDRTSQSPFIIFQGQKGHEDEPIKKVQQYIETNFQDKLTVEQLADIVAMGRRSLERRFKKATRNTIAEYIQRVKIEAAKKDLENSSKNVNEVMYEVGYSDTKAFRNSFKKNTGMTPNDYRNKYNREAIFA